MNKETIIFTATLSDPKTHEFKVNFNGDVIEGVCLITADVESLDARCTTDQYTLESALASVPSKRIKGYLTHERNPADAMRMPGFFSNLRIEGKKLLADFEFYQAFKDNFKADYELLKEQIKRTPDIFGASVECIGRTAASGFYVIDKLLAAAFVDIPALNESLFSALSLQSKDTSINDMKLIKLINEKFGADTAKLKRAFSLAETSTAATEEAVVAEIETKLTEEDKAKQLTDLTEANKKLTEENATLKEELAKLKPELETAVTKEKETASAFSAYKAKNKGVENFNLNDNDDIQGDLDAKYAALTDPHARAVFLDKYGAKLKK